VLGIRSRSRIGKRHSAHLIGQAEGIVEFPIGQQSGIGGDAGSVEFQLDATIEIDPQDVLLIVTHSISLSSRQEVTEDPCFSRIWRKFRATGDNVIWEIRVMMFTLQWPAASRTTACASDGHFAIISSVSSNVMPTP
jgi:hypothetical protein